MNWFLRFIATGFFIGEKMPAPGTAGTLLAAVVYYFFIPAAISSSVYWTMLIVITLVGIVSAGRAEEIIGEIDPPSVVIDEIAGFLIAMAFLPKIAALTLIGFIVFRVIDISKIYPMKKLEVVSGGLGIMLDDIYAGLLTNLILRIILVLWI